ncbi:MAG: protein kinase [Planctomycetota bacterium]|nr:protein kinase [Planctomycetota bacterium]
MSDSPHGSRAERIGTLLELVVPLSAGEREALLREQCGADTALIEEVLSLAAALQGAGEFLEAPVGATREELPSDLTGRRIGPFEVRRRIGEGGMGQVYEALDTRLDRPVALKVLHPTLAGSATVRARLAREARALAQLNHPGIAAIYGIEPCEHAPGGIVLVLEFVPGITLAARLRQGALEFNHALHISMAIADALEAAHARGIVHRDLKPSNIMLDPTNEHGAVKILDFGLAKAVQERSRSAETDDAAPTHIAIEQELLSSRLAVHVTGEGEVMGTAAYMSPEQARGAPIDRRTDIWSLGCVVAEMLGGKRIFDRGNTADTVAAVLREEPAFVSGVTTLPASIQTLLGMCLKKDGRERLRDAGDVKLLLAAAMVPPDASITARDRTSRRRWISALSLCTALSLASGWALHRTMHPATAEPHRLAFDVSVGTAKAQDNESNPLAINSDSIIVAVDDSSGSLLVRHSLTDGTSARIDGTTNASSPFYFADGTSLGYFDTKQGTLMRLNAPGQTPIPMATVGINLLWPVPLANGDVLFSRRWSGGVLRVRAGESRAHALEVSPALDAACVRLSCVLPDGKTILATVASQTRSTRTLEAIDTERGTRTLVLEDASEGYLIGSNTLVFLRQNTLLAVGFDARTLRVEGRETVVATGVGLTGLLNTGLLEATPEGTLVYIPHDPTSESSLSYVGSDRSLQSVVTDPVCLTDPEMAPDAKRIAATRYGETASIWVFDTSSTPPTQLQISKGVHATRPLWSPDGSRLAFVGYAPFPPFPGREGMQLELSPGTGIYIAESSGTSTPRLLYSSTQYPTRIYDWVPDGSALAVAFERDPARGFDIVIMDIADPSRQRDFIATDASEYGMRFSHDGKWMAFTRDTGGSSNVYAAPWPAGSPLVRVTPHGGYRARWARDDSSIYFQNEQGLFMVDVDPANPALVRSQPKLIDAGHVNDQYDIASDGRPITVTFRQAARSTLRVLTGFRRDDAK